MCVKQKDFKNVVNAKQQQRRRTITMTMTMTMAMEKKKKFMRRKAPKILSQRMKAESMFRAKFESFHAS